MKAVGEVFTGALEPTNACASTNVQRLLSLVLDILCNVKQPLRQPKIQPPYRGAVDSAPKWALGVFGIQPVLWFCDPFIRSRILSYHSRWISALHNEPVQHAPLFGTTFGLRGVLRGCPFPLCQTTSHDDVAYRPCSSERQYGENWICVTGEVSLLMQNARINQQK